MPPSDFLTRQQIAELYPIPLSTLKKLGMRGNTAGPPIIRIGGSIYYHVPSFEKWFLSFLGKSPNVIPEPGQTSGRRGRPTKAEIVERRRSAALSDTLTGSRS